MKIRQNQTKFDDLKEKRLYHLAAIESGNIDDSGIMKNVKVFVAQSVRYRLTIK
jgi:hypothetical protein